MSSKRRPTFPEPPSWARELTTVGVTGTNGKTSTTLLTAGALGAATSPIAQTTTVGSFIGRERIEVPMDFGGFLATMRRSLDGGGRHAVIELTSEALGLGFMRAWPCRVGVFTNLTRDHLDAHGTAEHYLASKAQLFMQLPPGGCAVLNGCDPAAELLAEVVPGEVRMLRYGAPSRGPAHAALDVEAVRVRLSWSGTEVAIASSLSLPERLTLRAIGEVFAENALGALCAAIALGVSPADALEGIANAPPPPGRFELVPHSGKEAGSDAAPHVVIDYAHTPDALSRTLQSARKLCDGALTVVFGAGGNRDQAKRPLMGEAAASADRVLLTSDNPRSEDPAEIAAAIREGLGGHGAVSLELDRGAAIRQAISDARAGDVVIIAGKGHETTQTIGAETRPFSDREIAVHALTARG